MISYNDHLLVDTNALADYNIVKESTLTMVARNKGYVVVSNYPSPVNCNFQYLDAYQPTIWQLLPKLSCDGFRFIGWQYQGNLVTNMIEIPYHDDLIYLNPIWEIIAPEIEINENKGLLEVFH